MWSNFIPLLRLEEENEDTTANHLPPIISHLTIYYYIN